MNFEIPPAVWALSFSVLGLCIGLAAFAFAVRVIPRAVDRMTPNIDEAKEMLRGNQAIGEYYGRVVSATILGAALIIAAAIIAGIHGA